MFWDMGLSCIRVFRDHGWARTMEVNADNHGGVLFTVRSEEDLQRFVRMFPEMRGQEDALRAEVGLPDLEPEPEPVSMPAPYRRSHRRDQGNA